MPPRYAYWTILIDNRPTAFRAREKEELLPTLQQLRRTNKDVVMKWFARGRLWESREDERESWQRGKTRAEAAPRGRDWRPGGQHKDSRDRFKKKNRPERVWSDAPRRPTDSAVGVRRDRDKLGPPRESRPWRDKARGPAPRGDIARPWSNKPGGLAPARPKPRNNRTRPPTFAPDRREPGVPPKPTPESRPEPPPRRVPPAKKPHRPERG